MSFFDDAELDKELKKIGTANVATTETVTAEATVKKRKTPSAASVSSLKKKLRRGPKTNHLAKEIKKLHSEESEAQRKESFVDGREMLKEIQQAETRALQTLSELDILLDVSTDAIAETTKYTNLIAQLEQNKTESALLEKVCSIFSKLVATTMAARETCANMPREFADLLSKTDAFMRASSSSLVPSGMSVFAKQSEQHNGQLVVQKGAPGAVVRFDGSRGTNTFRLVCEDANRTEVSELENSYLATSMMQQSFDARVSTSAKSNAQRDAQRKTALLNAGNEVTPALYGSAQYRELQKTIGAVVRTSNLIGAPEQLSIEAAK